jgi:hypothetical protein
MPTTPAEKREQDRKRAALYRLKKGIKPRPPAMTPEEKKRRHREAEILRRRERGMEPRVFFATAEEKHEARLRNQARYRLKKRMSDPSREIE